MPDQSSAADEHAILQEITAPLAGLPDNPVPIAADVHFPIVLRGYDRIAVDAYVKRTSQLVAELQATHSPEAAVRRALERVGEQISGILQRAHDTAEEITSQSRREAEDRLEVARLEATRIAADGVQRVKDLDTDTDRIWAERLRIIEDARELAAQLSALADEAAERFPPAEDAAQTAQPELFDVEGAAEGEEDQQAEPSEQGPDFEPEPEPEYGSEDQTVEQAGPHDYEDQTVEQAGPHDYEDQTVAQAGPHDHEDPDATAVLPQLDPVQAPLPPASDDAPADG